MTSANGPGSWGKRVFIFLMGLAMVMLFSVAAFADGATTRLAQATPAAGTPENPPPGKIERAGQTVGKGIEKGATATGQGLKRAVNATERGLKRAGNATARGLEKAGGAVKRVFSGQD